MFPPFLLLNSHSEAQDHPNGRGDTHRPLVAVTTVVSTPATIKCGSSATILSVPQRPFVTTGLYPKQQVIPSALMEALMQHYQAAGFSDKVSRLGAAPRRPSTSTQPIDFQGRSLSLLQLLHVGDLPQIECTMTGGYASLPGLH